MTVFSRTADAGCGCRARPGTLLPAPYPDVTAPLSVTGPPTWTFGSHRHIGRLRIGAHVKRPGGDAKHDRGTSSELHSTRLRAKDIHAHHERSSTGPTRHLDFDERLHTLQLNCSYDARKYVYLFHWTIACIVTVIATARPEDRLLGSPLDGRLDSDLLATHCRPETTSRMGRTLPGRPVSEQFVAGLQPDQAVPTVGRIAHLGYGEDVADANQRSHLGIGRQTDHLVGTTHLPELPGDQYGHSVSQRRGFVEVVRDLDDRGAEVSVKPLQLALQFEPGGPVKGRKRFIEQEQLWFDCQSTGKGDPLLLAAGETFWVPGEQLTYAKQRSELCHPLSVAPSKAEADVLLDRQMGEQRVVLVDKPDPASLRRLLGHLRRTEPHPAGFETAQSRYSLEQHGFAGGGRAKNHEVFASGDRQLVYGEPEASCANTQSFNPNHGRLSRPPCRPRRRGNRTARMTTRITSARSSKRIVTGSAADSPNPAKRSYTRTEMAFGL